MKYFIFVLLFMSFACTDRMDEVKDCNDFESAFSLTDTDGDGLTDCEETSSVDNPNTELKPIGMTDPNNPFNGVLDTFINKGGSLNESFKSVVKTIDGGFVVLGFTQSQNGDIVGARGSNDFWVLKYDMYQNLEWSKIYGGTNEDIAARIIQLSDGSYALTGFSKSDDIDLNNNKGQKDVWVMRISETGDIMWSKSYGFTGDEEGLSIIENKNGDLVVCGYIDVTASGGKGNDFRFRQHGVGDIWVLKLNSNGDKIWRRYFGGTNNDRAYDLIQAEDGGYLVAGTSESEDFDISKPNGSYDYWLVKLSEDGNMLWEKSFGGEEIDDCLKIVAVENNNFLLIGNTFSYNQNGINNKGYSDAWLVKIDSKGNILWQNTYGGSAFDAATSAFYGKKGEYIIVGNTRSKDKDLSDNKGQNDIWVFKTDKNGKMIWNRNYGGSGIDIANDVIELNNYALIVIGESNSKEQDVSDNKGYSDAVILKIR